MEKIIADLAEMLASQQYIREARKSAGWRELYAIEHDTPQRSGDKITWRYSEADEYQDGNGATYDIERRQWVR